MSGILQDFAYAIRRLKSQPAFTAVMIVVFAIGIGVNTAMFSIVNAALFRPLPVRDPGRLSNVYCIRERGARPSFLSYPDYIDLREQKGAFDDILAFTAALEPVTAERRTEVAPCELVSFNYFDVLGITPSLGRTFLPDERATAGAQPVAVISHGLWKKRFNSDSSVLGTELKINGHSFRIVGVAPPPFKGLWFPDVASAQVWIPIEMAGAINTGIDLADRSRSEVLAIGRLAPGVSLKQAQAAADIRARQLERSYPATNRTRNFRLFPTSSVRIPAEPSAGAVPSLISVALLAVSGTILIIAGMNIAGLLAARGITRRKEIAIRLAIGAGRWKIVRQLLAETVLLSGFGGLLGMVLAKVLLAVALANIPEKLEFIELSLELPIDIRVLLFTFLVCLGTGVLVGLGPALRISRADLVTALNSEGLGSGQQRRRGLRYWILVPQICCSLALLVIAGLFVWTVLQAQWLDPGFETAHVATASIDLEWNKYSEEKGREFWHRLLAEALTMPGVTSASLVNGLPLSGMNGPPRKGVQTERELIAGTNSVHAVYSGDISPGYFLTMSIPIVRGRDFDSRDGKSSSPVVIISQSAARSFWPGEEPLGKQLALPDRGKTKLYEVIGVVKNVRGSALERVQLPYVYVPFEQQYSRRMVLIARTPGDPRQLTERLRALVYKIDENVSALETKTLAENVGFILYLLRMAAAILAVCGMFGLVLATVGLYGVVSYSVAQRTREIGIRAALGAQRRDIMTMVIGEGIKVTLAGTILGLLVSLAARRYILMFSLGIVKTNPVVFIAVPVVLGIIVLLACYIPARRATRVGPMAALREL
jgi:predicted permease